MPHLEREIISNNGAVRVKATLRDVEGGRVLDCHTANIANARERQKLAERFAVSAREPKRKKKNAEAFDQALLATVDEATRLASIESEARAKAAREQAERDEQRLRSVTGGLYAIDQGGLVWNRQTRDGGEEKVRLTNFTARIVANVVRDDGAEREQHFAMMANVRGREHSFTVLAAQFIAMTWPVDLGPDAILSAGAAVRDRAREGFQVLSLDNLKTRTVYTHCGWRESEGRSVYLHGGGAIGAEGAVDAIDVELSDALDAYRLPDPPAGDELVACVRASLGMLALGPASLILPHLAATYRAAIGSCDFALHDSGPSGVFKSELAALCNQHFGAGLDARHLPGSWSSTDNALEGQAFTLKDALFVIDDFAPTGTATDTQRLHRTADRVIRAAGNHSGRQRMRPDGTLRPTKPPRCLILSTGEETPRGQSLRARLWISEIGPGDIDAKVLTTCQRDAAAGLYAGSMAAFIRWLAARRGADNAGNAGLWRGETLRAQLRASALASGSHRRTPEIVANLALGLRTLLDFALDSKAITKAQAAELWATGWEAIGASAARQQSHQLAAEPTRRFLELLSAALGSGAAHLAGRDGLAPANAAACGWRQRTVGNPLYPRDELEPMGARIGWVDAGTVYLDGDASYRAVQQMAQGAEGLAIGPTTLRRRLDERGLLIRDGTDELTVRRALEGSKRRVLALRPGTLPLSEPGTPGIPGTGPSDGGENADSVPGLVPGLSDEFDFPAPKAGTGAIASGQSAGNAGSAGFPEGGEGSGAHVNDDERDALQTPGM